MQRQPLPIKLGKLYTSLVIWYQAEDKEELERCVQKWRELPSHLKDDFNSQLVNWGLTCKEPDSTQEFIRGISQQTQFDLMVFWFAHHIDIYDFLLKNQDLLPSETRLLISLVGRAQFLQRAVERQLNAPNVIEQRFFLRLEKTDREIFDALIALKQAEHPILSPLLQTSGDMRLQFRLSQIDIPNDLKNQLNELFIKLFLPIRLEMESKPSLDKKQVLPERLVYKIFNYSDNIFPLIQLSRKIYIQAKQSIADDKVDIFSVHEFKKYFLTTEAQKYSTLLDQIQIFNQSVIRYDELLYLMEKELKSSKSPRPWSTVNIAVAATSILTALNLLWFGYEWNIGTNAVNLINTTYDTTQDSADGIDTCAKLTLKHYPDPCDTRIWWLNQICIKACETYRSDHDAPFVAGMFLVMTAFSFLTSLFATLCDPNYKIANIIDFRKKLPLKSYSSEFKKSLQDPLALEDKKVDITLPFSDVKKLIAEFKRDAVRDKSNFAKLHSLNPLKPKKTLRALKSVYQSQLGLFESKPPAESKRKPLEIVVEEVADDSTRPLLPQTQLTPTSRCVVM